MLYRSHPAFPCSFLLCFIAALGLGGGAVRVFAQDPPLPAQSLTILHTNDLHAHISPNEQGVGGFAYLATALQQERAHCERCLYLNAGDLVQGTPVSTIYRGLPIYEIANHLGLDASTLGNHEFDYGYERIKEFVRTAQFPVVSANVVDEQGHLLAGSSYTIKTVKGLRVGIIGVVLADLVPNFTTADKLGPYRVVPVAEAVRQTAQQIKDKADILVVLGHIHDEETDAILQQVPEVAVVVAGHDHKGYTSIKRTNDGRVAVENKGYGVELGRLDLQLDPARHKVVAADWRRISIEAKALQPDPEVAQLVAEWETKVSQVVDAPIGTAVRKLTGDDLRQLIERAMCDATGADLAYVNKGNVRDIFPAGTLLARNVWNVLPYDNTIVVGKFKGSQLPAVVRQRNPIDPDREYTLATTDFIAANQSAPDQFHTTGLVFQDTGKSQRDVVIDWVKQHKTVGEPLAASAGQ